jgi:type IV pilus assembly protein PilA
MKDWYYHDPAQGRVGPLTDDDMRNRYRDRRLARDTLVWHDGMREWQPLDRCFEELQLDTIVPDASRPPPLPPAAPPMQFASAASAYPHSHASERPKGMSGCAIAAIVLAVVAVPVIAILAAIAIPAYQDYTLRAKVSQAVVGVAPVEMAIEQAVAGQQACPGNGEAGIGTPESFASPVVVSANVGQFEGGHCGIELILRGHPKLAGKHLWFERTSSNDAPGWACSSDLDDKYLPAQCR